MAIAALPKAACFSRHPPLGTNALGQHAVLPLPSDPDKHLTLPQPPAEGPQNAEDEEA